MDFILERSNGIGVQPLPFEVKQSNSINRKDLKGLYRFMDEYPCEQAFVISDDLEKTGDRIHYVPLWKWLLENEENDAKQRMGGQK